MLGRSALLRVLLMAVAAAGLLALAREYLTVDARLQPGTPVAVAEPAPSAPVRRPVEPAATARTAAAAPAPALAPAPVAAPAPSPTPAAPAWSAGRPAAGSLFGTQASAGEPVLPPAPAGDAGPAEASGGEVGWHAAILLDLNTASLAELNTLKGAGAVGRAIVQHRPYASIDDLLSKRVLSRSLFQRVRTQVTVGDRAAAR